MKRKTGSMFSVIMIFALLIAGCGGGGGDSSPAGTSVPTNVRGVAGHGQVTISWDNVTGATSYNIYFDNTTPVSKSTGNKITSAPNPRIFTGLTNNTTYYFVVTAFGPNGESADSSQVAVTPTPDPLPAVPSNVGATAGHGTVTVSWDNVTGATSYNIYYDNTTPVAKATADNIIGATSPKIVTGLTNGTTYHFVVTAVNANGESAFSAEKSATPTITPATAAPTGVTATPGPGQVSIAWDNVTGATSYNIYYSTTSGVTKSTGTKVAGVTSPKAVTGLIRGIPYWFVVTALNSDNVESTDSSERSATPNSPNPTYSQADLTGTWTVRVLLSGAGAGWYGATLTFDSSGNVTNTTNQVGSTTLTIPALSVTTDVLAGVVGGTGASTGQFFGKMSTSKNLIAGTSTLPGGTTFAMYVFVKRAPGVTFAGTDLANTTIGYHKLYSGGSHYWERGNGSINGSGQLVVNSMTNPDGTFGPFPATGITIDSTTGIVSIADQPTFSGVMTPDKKLIVGASTDSAGVFELSILQMRGQSYSQADLAGDYYAFSFVSATTSKWARAIWTTDGSGNVTTGTIQNSDGTTSAPVAFTNILNAQGVVAENGGMLSFGKDLLVSNEAVSGGSVFEIKVQ